jgi:6,7-dimethyl-8-ribityllumazine synthase
VKRTDAALPPAPDCAGRRFAIITARFHGDIAEQLVAGARQGLRACRVEDQDVVLCDVAGCFELPLGCRKLIDTERFDALVALGAVIRGQTAHFEFVARECARGIMDLQLATGMPIGFGVLTTDDLDQAEERADPKRGNKGYTAALAAAEMLCLNVDLPRAGLRRN